jgi:isopenicillin-N epimerase
VSVPIHTNEPEKLQRLLFEGYKIEVPLMRQGSDVYLRYSIQAFNTRKNLDYLLETLKILKAKGELIQ